MEEGKLVGVLISLQGGFVHQTTDGKVSHQQTEELLLYQFWRLAAQHNLSSAKMCLQLVQSGLDFPSLVIEGCQFFGWGLLVIEDRCNQPVQRLGSFDVLQTVIDHTHDYPVTPISPVRGGRVNPAQVRAIWQSLLHIQTGILARAPEQVRSCLGCHTPELVTRSEEGRGGEERKGRL